VAVGERTSRHSGVIVGIAVAKWLTGFILAEPSDHGYSSKRQIFTGFMQRRKPGHATLTNGHFFAPISG
jgi:hypothetical protein